MRRDIGEQDEAGGHTQRAPHRARGEFGEQIPVPIRPRLPRACQGHALPSARSGITTRISITLFPKATYQSNRDGRRSPKAGLRERTATANRKTVVDATGIEPVTPIMVKKARR